MFLKSETIDLMRQEHREIKGCLQSLLDVELPITDKKKIFAILAPLLEAHSQREEEVVYKYMLEQGLDLEALALASEVEHALIDQITAWLEIEETHDNEWAATAKVLAQTVFRHLENEENDVFPILEKSLNSRKDDKLSHLYKSDRSEWEMSYKGPLSCDYLIC